MIPPQDLLLILFGSAIVTSLSDIFGKKLGVKLIPGYIASLSLAVTLLFSIGLKPGKYSPQIAAPIPEAELIVDGLSKLLVQLFLAVAASASVHSLSYMREDDDLGAYFTLLLLLTAGVAGAVLSNDLFTFYCFWELTSISAYSLVGFRWWHWEPAEASLKYLFIGTSGALVTLYSVSLVYGLAGTTNFEEVKLSVAGLRGSMLMQVISTFFLIGLGTSAALVPFHSWLPDAHPAAPSPVSALLSGVVVNVPLYLMMRLYLGILPANLNLGYALIAMGLLSSIFGNLAALRQLDVKRFLAYSTIANVGYMLVGLGAAHRALSVGSSYQAVEAVTGMLIHMVNHSLSKSLLFLCIGNAIHGIGSRLFESLEGYGRGMRLTGVLSAIGLLNLAGIPPLAGYWGKMLITVGLAFKLQDPVITLALLLLEANFALAAGAYAYFIFREYKGLKPKVKEAPLYMILPELALALACTILSLNPALIVETVRSYVEALLGR